MCFYFSPLIGLECITGAPILYHDLMSDPELRQKSCEQSSGSSSVLCFYANDGWWVCQNTTVILS